MDKIIRDNIIQSIKPRINQYVDNMNDSYNPKTIDFYRKHIEGILNFIDGINE